MVTPDILVGTEIPWTRKQFGREIKLGLKTRRHVDAVRLRDVRIGQVKHLEAEALASAGQKSIGKIIDLTPENAAEWRQMRDDADTPTLLTLSSVKNWSGQKGPEKVGKPRRLP